MNAARKGDIVVLGRTGSYTAIGGMRRAGETFFRLARVATTTRAGVVRKVQVYPTHKFPTAVDSSETVYTIPAESQAAAALVWEDMNGRDFGTLGGVRAAISIKQSGKSLTHTNPGGTLTQAEVSKAIRALGLTFRKTEHGEYRVSRGRGDEIGAYYTNDLQDALGTATLMAKGR